MRMCELWINFIALITITFYILRITEVLFHWNYLVLNYTFMLISIVWIHSYSRIHRIKKWVFLLQICSNSGYLKREIWNTLDRKINAAYLKFRAKVLDKSFQILSSISYLAFAVNRIPLPFFSVKKYYFMYKVVLRNFNPKIYFVGYSYVQF